jgi:hypothetical protein
VPAQPVELLQERGGRRGVGTVIEGEGHVVRPAPAHQPGGDANAERGDTGEGRAGVDGPGRADQARRGEGGGEGCAQRRPSRDRR